MPWIRLPAVSRLARTKVELESMSICICVPGAFGGGDIKFTVPVGLMLGVERTMLAGMVAVFLAGSWSILLVMRGKILKFPFGPALCIGSFVALVFANA